MRLLAVAVAGVAAFLSAPSGAVAATTCPAHYLGGQGPSVDKDVVARSAVELCSRGYAALYSPLTFGPVASSEHLTSAMLDASARRGRDNAFHPDARLPDGQRASLQDWSARGSCIDRGHMANDKDQGSPEDAYETYAMSNMIPQDTDNNERLWEGIESAVRGLAKQYGDVYVVTGPIFDGASVQRLNGKIAIPTRIFKAFYVPSQRMVGVYLANNAAGEQYWSVSVDELRAISQVDAFPALPAALRGQAMAQLPKPQSHFHTNREVEGKCTPIYAAPGNAPGAAPAAAQEAPRPGQAPQRETGILAEIGRGAASAGRAVMREFR